MAWSIAKRLHMWPVALGLILVVGCGSTVNNTPGMAVREVDVSRPGLRSGTGPESQDVVAIADKMMRSLLSSPVIADAPTPPTVAMLEFRNRSRFPLDSRLFLRKLRVSLNSKAGGRMSFLGRERMGDIEAERRAKRSGRLSSDTGKAHKAAAGADYFLTGELGGLAKSSAAGRSDYLLYTFSLINAESSAVVWEDEFETKRVGQDDAVYR